MTESDKELYNEKIDHLRDEIKSNSVLFGEKLDHILKNVDRTFEQSKITNGRVTRLEMQTIIWRWFERRPVRILIGVILVSSIYIKESRDVLFNFFKLFI